MTKLPANFDWRKSPAHIDLLSHFIKPRDVSQVLNWQYLKDGLRESPKDAIARFVQDGVLIPCELDEVLHCAFSTFDLKKIAREQGLKLTGTKAELVERLISADRPKMEQLANKFRIMKCTPHAVEIVENYERRKQQALELAKQQSFEALLKGDARAAYKIFLAYQREYIATDVEVRTDEIEKLNFILTSAPKVLGEISEANLASLRAATCMSVLWHDESAENWLPESFTTHLRSNKIAINYLKCNAEIREDLARYGTYTGGVRVKLVFDENDIESCDLCLRLNGKVFDLREFPELPFENCTSETGCKCRIEGVFENDENEVLDEECEEGFKGDDAFEKLSQLKRMLDNELITEEEYKQKKADILSRI